MGKIKEFVKGHKVVCIIGGVFLVIGLVIAFILLFVGTPQGKEEVLTIEDKVRQDAEISAEVYVMLRYDTTYQDAYVTSLTELENGEWEVYGKISARDNYSDSYTGKFYGTCTVDENEEADCDVDVETLYKDR